MQIIRKKNAKCKKLVSIICLSTYCSLYLTGCGVKFTRADVEKGYSTMYAMSAAEYTIFMSKNVSVASNLLVTRISMADKVADGDYPASSEIQNTEECLSKMQSVIDDVTVTMPAQGYESDRENLLDLLNEAYGYIADYETAIEEKDKSKIKDLRDKMSASFAAIGGTANVAYQ